MECIKAVKSNMVNELHALSSFGGYVETLTDLPEQNYSDDTELLYLKELADEELIRLFAKEKNEEAFNEIVERYAERIYRLALRITRNHSDAEEVLQEVFIVLVEKLDTFRKESKFSTWLYRVAANVSYMRLRNERKYHSHVSLDNYVSYDEDGNLKGVEIKDWSNMPDETIINSEKMEILEKAINELPESYRVVFHLRDVEGLSNKEIAEVLGVSLPAVKSRVHRARLFLRGKLSDYFHEYGK